MQGRAACAPVALPCGGVKLVNLIASKKKKRERGVREMLGYPHRYKTNYSEPATMRQCAALYRITGINWAQKTGDTWTPMITKGQATFLIKLEWYSHAVYTGSCETRVRVAAAIRHMHPIEGDNYPPPERGVLYDYRLFDPMPINKN